MKPRLLTISGSRAGALQQVAETPFSIGRDPSNQLNLADPVVSYRHCALYLTDDGQFELVDLESHNGTYINGIPIHRRLVQHGDTIRVGDTELLFLTHEGEEVPSPARHNTSPFAATFTMLSDSATIPSTFGIELGRMARDPHRPAPNQQCYQYDSRLRASAVRTPSAHLRSHPR